MAEENTQLPRVEQTPQWTNYEVKPELRGDRTLVVYTTKRGTRHISIAPELGRCNSPLDAPEKVSIQRVYRHVNPDNITDKYYFNLSNNALDKLILQPKVK
ncbi:MAG: hypothetical protein KKB21_02170 [Nanoarchaeota archaeon]|nr:hypothetical protein [Nanoarchaeota archaeon]